jgi:hypothetical protein
MRRFALLFCMTGLAAVAAVPALAAGPADQAARRWKQADACVADANKQVPDHNEAALHKRDDLVNACMAAHGLPPLTGLAQPRDAQAKPADPAAPATPAKPN